MISAGSAVPNDSGTRNFPAAHRTCVARRCASWPLVALACVFVQSCGSSENSGLAGRESPMRDVASAKGDRLLTPRLRTAELVHPATGNSLAGRDPTRKDAGSGKADKLVTPRFRTAALTNAAGSGSFVGGVAAADGVSLNLGSQAGNRTGTIPSVMRGADSTRPALATGGYPGSGRSSPGPDMAGKRPTAPSGANKLASLSPELPYGVSALKAGHTDLIGFDNSAFPYYGTKPRNERAFSGSRYSDNRVLVHVPAGFDIRKPGVIVVFFHGHGATLARDVRDRQLLPAQISESGANAVLVAPQLAYDAADSSAGKFWERGGLKRFMAEAAGHLARLYGDPRTAEAFAKMPIIIVAYSGGFVSAAYSLHVGGVGDRITGVVLLDALYGELDKFASFILDHRSAFFVSAYTHHTKHRDDELARILRDKGVPVTHHLDGGLAPGTVAFLPTGEGIRHRDYVTLAWTKHPVTDVLQRVAER
jgi:hypothetical protein